MRPVHFLLLLTLLLASCGGAQSEPTEDTRATTSPATSTPGSTDESTTTTDMTTTTEGLEDTTTAPEAPEGPRFAITNVTFGDAQMVVITNVGDEAGNLGGHFLCNRPSYWGFPDIEVPAGQSIAVSTGGTEFNPPAGSLTIDGTAGVGPLFADDGEMGLYNSQEFGSPSAILSYVEWGSEGHGRASVAIEAGIWNGFVATSGQEIAIEATNSPPVSADDWRTIS